MGFAIASSPLALVAPTAVFEIFFYYWDGHHKAPQRGQATLKPDLETKSADNIV